MGEEGEGGLGSKHTCTACGISRYRGTACGTGRHRQSRPFRLPIYQKLGDISTNGKRYVKLVKNLYYWVRFRHSNLLNLGENWRLKTGKLKFSKNVGRIFFEVFSLTINEDSFSTFFFTFFTIKMFFTYFGAFWDETNCTWGGVGRASGSPSLGHDRLFSHPTLFYFRNSPFFSIKTIFLFAMCNDNKPVPHRV